MMEIRTPKTHKAKRVLEQRVPKLLCFVALTIGNLCIHLVYVIFVPPAPLHPHIYSNGHICLGISLSISFCFFTLCIMFFVLFLVSLCWMLLSAV
ncbi:hypothetical protein HID58_061150 [Brassica napus]|uniref:Uncharacterized protein n=1 Tax=Brassica napus TaxID=3708 RepID=A0ABQ7ZXW1_BRANA|nr:hypothetical protein HID58_061150 [Brassica napus]